MDYDITLADRRKPWDAASWSDGQKPIIAPEDLLSATEMLEASGLAGWNVRKEEIFTASGTRVPRRYATVTEDGRVLGDVGAAYTVIQSEEAFSFADKIVDDGQGKWERAGYFRGGSTVFGAMELAHLDISVPGDDSAVKPYLLVVNSFDGGAYQGVLAFIRPVCVNTFEAAKGTQTPYRFSIRHTGTLEGKIQMAREALGIAFRHAEEVKAIVERLATKAIVDEQVLKILRKSVWPVDADAMSEGHLENHASTKVYENYLTSPTIDGIRGTAWGAFNAVTEYVDHVAAYRGKVQEDADLRGANILFGTGADRKAVALEAFLKAK